ncbi:MAG: TolC family protein [Gammaproteobacteria bacterium]|jgi:outer membrane protein TolC|nr:TolC family protein [Gammaproteobacteria bacterium]MBT3723516.1 TolC family protein [Gammaproteobacteria bacterium]MBT4194276.1 TolC family protein [Gammaproteobacteria bacterium]MBT4450830.1 TolC family protein [Gammaproteobacteria bacterium]MBT4859727.1 TolC family protein [Gammaproteobacteria bacterium]
MKTLLFFIVIFISAPAAAVTTINLDQAIEMSLLADPRIEEKRAYVRKAQALLQEAEGSGGLRYSIDAYLAITTGVDGGFYENGETSCTTDCAPRDDTYEFEDGLSLWSTFTFSIIKPLTTFGQLEGYQEAARNNILIKQQDITLEKEAIKLDVVRAYNGYLAARDGRYLLQDTKKRLQSAHDLVKGWLDEDNGKAKLSDQYALEAGLGLVESLLADTSALEAIAMEGLKLLTGLDRSEQLELEDRRLRAGALPDNTLDEWIEIALSNRVEFKQVEAGLAARRALVAAKRASKKPIIFAGIAGSAAYAPNRDHLDNPHIFDPFNHAALSPLIGMRWQWEADAQPARVAQEQAELDALLHKASFARKGIPFQVAEQFHYVQAKYKSLNAMKNSAQSARRWMIASYTDFEAGLEEADKILTALQAYVLAYAEYLKIVNDYNNHLSKLNSVSGVYE